MNAGNLKRDFFFFFFFWAERLVLLKSLFPLMLSHGQVGKETPHTHHDWEYLSKICKTFYLPQIL